MKRSKPVINGNITVQLLDPLRERVSKAMEATGSRVVAEFTRTALLDRCRKIEAELRQTSPAEFERIYGKNYAP